MRFNNLEEEVCWWMLADISVVSLLPSNQFFSAWEKMLNVLLCSGLSFSSRSLYLPFSCWVFGNRLLMLMFRIRKKQNVFKIGSCFEAAVVGVAWAVSSLPKLQLILVGPGSDLLLKGIEILIRKWNFLLFLHYSFKLPRENIKANCYANEELKGVEYLVPFKTSLITDRGLPAVCRTKSFNEY